MRSALAVAAVLVLPGLAPRAQVVFAPLPSDGPVFQVLGFSQVDLPLFGGTLVPAGWAASSGVRITFP